MSKEKFERTKPVLNVGIIGHVDHGNGHNATTWTIVFEKMTMNLEKGVQ